MILALLSRLYGPVMVQLALDLHPLPVAQVVEQNRQDRSQEAERRHQEHDEAKAILEPGRRRLVLHIAEQAQACANDQPRQRPLNLVTKVFVENTIPSPRKPSFHSE